MSVTPNNVVLYGSADMATADGTVTGGAVSFSTRIGFSPLAAAGTYNYVSDSASDTAVTITITGRNSAGTIVSETKTLTGTTPVTGSVSFLSSLQGVAAGTTAVGDVAAVSATAVGSGTAQGGGNTSGTVGPYITVAAGTGGSYAVEQIVQAGSQLRRIVGISTDTVYVDRDWTSVPTSSTTYTINSGFLFESSPNQITKIIALFYNCQAQASGGSNLTFYAKMFMVNNNTVTDAQAQSGHTGVNFAITGNSPTFPPGSALQLGLASALNDTATITNRQTAPAGITFTTGGPPVNQDMSANGGVLPHGAAPNAAGAQAIWLALTLNAGTSPYDGSPNFQELFATT